jgi:hypothetical protein
MRDTNIHVVRELLAKLAVKLSQQHPEELQRDVSILLQALVICVS